MSTLKRLTVILLGGTISKITNDVFDNTYFAALLAQCRINTDHLILNVVDVFARDSTTFTDAEINYIACVIKSHLPHSDAMLVLMGTDGMIKVATDLDNLLNTSHNNITCPIITTGAIIPYRHNFTDSLFNFGFAAGVALYSQTPGIYICMNGLKLRPQEAYKNYNKLEFAPVIIT